MLPLPNSPKAARCAYIFPELKSVSLLSSSQLFDQGCKVNFTPEQVLITLENQTILSVSHNNNITGLWTVLLTNPSTPQPKPWVPPHNTYHYTYTIQTFQPPAVIHQSANNYFFTKKYRSWCHTYTHHDSDL